MYYSKQNGGNSCVFYSSDMNAAAVERLMLKSKLKRAIERDEFLVRYMPKVDLITGHIVGAEALLRWRLPGHGDIPPSQFIPLAEENNLILPVGQWVLNRVCADYRAMTDVGRKPGRVALNLSLKQLRQASFMLQCRSVFEKHGVSPQNLELEITETTLMADPKRTIGMLKELNALGVHLSIDDFGTGYSSLSALQQFPIGSLKVDQSFVRNAARGTSDATLVRTIVEMGRTLGLLVVAEGLETVEQLAFLQGTKCHYGQGRLFGEPCTAEELSSRPATGAAGAPTARKTSSGCASCARRPSAATPSAAWPGWPRATSSACWGSRRPGRAEPPRCRTSLRRSWRRRRITGPRIATGCWPRRLRSCRCRRWCTRSSRP
jgi:EAL domain-containing protein (putative c-di-GMP-specific phosphodiesterase class I)